MDENLYLYKAMSVDIENLDENNAINFLKSHCDAVLKSDSENFNLSIFRIIINSYIFFRKKGYSVEIEEILDLIGSAFVEASSNELNTKIESNDFDKIKEYRKIRNFLNFMIDSKYEYSFANRSDIIELRDKYNSFWFNKTSKD